MRILQFVWILLVFVFMSHIQVRAGFDHRASNKITWTRLKLDSFLRPVVIKLNEIEAKLRRNDSELARQLASLDKDLEEPYSILNDVDESFLVPEWHLEDVQSHAEEIISE